MALIAEEVVDEWLNRQGFFTIRGTKIGNNEIDILAIRQRLNELPLCRHIEVHIALNPVSYITNVPLQTRRATGRAANNAAKRGARELREGVKEWIQKKYSNPNAHRLRQSLCRGKWTKELVVYKLRHADELNALKRAGIKITHFQQVIKDLQGGKLLLPGAAGRHLIELMTIARQQTL